MCKISAFSEISPEKPTKRQKFYIFGRSRYNPMTVWDKIFGPSILPEFSGGVVRILRDDVQGRKLHFYHAEIVIFR